MTPRVKICGITRASDAVLAASLGAAAIGFIFWPRSPRAVRPEAARRIADALPPFVTTVGVFVDQSVDEIMAIAAAVPLGAVQLHGDERIAEFEPIGRPLIKAVRMRGEGEPLQLASLPSWVTVLLDAHDPARVGGTGRTIDWSVAASVAQKRKVILSGGLRPENVAEAAATVRPLALDVSSGVETAPGLKDPDKLRAFFRAVEGARS